MATPCASSRPFVELIGAEAALALIEAFGGTRLYIPGSPGGLVASCVGEDAARKLSAEFSCCSIVVPLARSWRCQIYRERGLSYPRIARKLGIREDAVWKILRAAQMTAGPQPSDTEARP